MAEKIIWQPTKNKDIREWFLAKLIELRNDEKINLWLEEIDGHWCYVITPYN